MMKFYLLIYLLFFICLGNVFAQNANKCGFPERATITAERLRTSKKVLARPSPQQSIVSPKGYFRIHYDVTGFSAVKYSLSEFAKAADSAYDFETAHLGFLPPPGDNGAGGDNLYDIYIQNISGYYGFTEPEDEIRPGSATYYSYIVIHHSFEGYYTTGIQAARVTIAHELHHAIQIGNYIARFVGNANLDQYFYELTSTAMEDMVFPDVNDYVAYASDLFSRPDLSFALHSGYDLAVWNLYLFAKKNKYLFKRQWELLREYRAAQAIEYSLAETGSSLQAEMQTFIEWLFYTNYRSQSGKYFPDASLLPALRPILTAVFSEPGRKFTVSVNPFSIAGIRHIRSLGLSTDTVYTFAANTEYLRSIDSASATRTYTDGLYSSSVSGAVQISSGYFRTFSGGGGQWQLLSFVNNLVAGGGNNGNIQSSVDAYPSPFIKGRSGTTVNIPFRGPGDIFIAELQVLNQAGYVFCAGKYSIITSGERMIRLIPENGEGRILPTGVYIYHLTAGSYKQTGKIVIING